MRLVRDSDLASGTAGEVRVVLEIANHGRADMACTASLAHWYSADLGTAAPGTTLEVVLWHEPRTGVLNLLNTARDRMPVVAIWCRCACVRGGTPERVALPLKAGLSPHACAESAGKT